MITLWFVKVASLSIRLKTDFFIVNEKFQVDTFASVYKHLTGKEVTFEFPEPLF